MGIVKIIKNKDGGKNITFSSIEKISEIYGINQLDVKQIYMIFLFHQMV